MWLESQQNIKQKQQQTFTQKKGFGIVLKFRNDKKRAKMSRKNPKITNIAKWGYFGKFFCFFSRRLPLNPFM